MYSHFDHEIETVNPRSSWQSAVGYFTLIVLIAVVLTLILADLIYGAEVVSEWLGSVVYKLIN